MQIRCPYCQNSVESVGDGDLFGITCSSCGNSFSLHGDETRTFQDTVGKSLGHFELVEEIGQGAFGTVWKARDTHLDRTVAVKLPRVSTAGDKHLQQFLHEARAAAQLKHPNIVAVHEVGTEDGHNYIVSDFIEGVSLSSWLTGRRPTAKETASLCQRLAMGLHHAHEGGVIHRDLKPGNVMLDNSLQPHIMDFGLAKREAAEVSMTVEGKVIGTPAFMSPEQARGEAGRVDRRTDIYSLGVIMFQMLTGELPFRGDLRMLVHQIINDEAPTPRSLNASIPRDLDTICTKCLQKSPDDRYATADDVANELDRFLNGTPIVARPISSFARSVRWCRRNAILSLAASIALILGLVLAAGGPIVAWQQARLAEQIRGQLYESDIAVAMDASRRGDWQRLGDALQRHLPISGQKDLRGFEWFMLFHRWNAANNVVRLKLESLSSGSSNSGDSPAIESVSLLGPNQLLVGHHEGLTLFDLTSGARRHLWQGEMLIAQVGREGLTISAGRRGILRMHRDIQSEAIELENDEGNVEYWRFGLSRDGTQLATTVWAHGVGENWLDIWDLVSTKKVQTLRREGHGFYDACFAPNAEAIATAGWDDETVCIWTNDGSQSPIHELEAFGGVGVVRYSPNGDFIVAGCGDGFIRVWRTTDYRLVHEVEAHAGRITVIAWDAEGASLVSAARDSKVKLWRFAPTTGRLRIVDEFHGHSDQVFGACFLRDGRVASGGRDGRVLIWNVEDNPRREVLRGHTNLVRAVSITSDGRFVASGGHDYDLRLWDLTEDESFVLKGHVGAIRDLAISPNDRLIASGGWDGRVILWDLPNRKRLQVLDHQLPVWNVWFSDNGDVVYAGGQSSGNRLVLAWDIRSGTAIDLNEIEGQTPSKPHQMSTAARLVIASGQVPEEVIALGEENWREVRRDRDGIGLFEIPSGAEVGRLTGHEQTIWDLAIAREAGVLVSAGEDKTVRVWRAASSQEVRDAGW